MEWARIRRDETGELMLPLDLSGFFREGDAGGVDGAAR